MEESTSGLFQDLSRKKKIHTRKAQEDQSKLIEMNLNLTDSMNANAVSLDRSDP